MGIVGSGFRQEYGRESVSARNSERSLPERGRFGLPNNRQAFRETPAMDP